MSESIPSADSPAPVVGYVLKMYPRFSETFVVSEILAREAQGEQIVIFSLRPTTDSRFHPELARVKAPVVHVPRPSSATRLWDALSAGPASGVAEAWEELRRHSHDDAAQAVAVARLAREHGVTHLHAHFASVATTVARLAGRIAGLPYSFTAHAKDIFHQDVDPTDLKAKLADAHHAITISGYNLADLRRRFPEATDTLQLVRNGLELERFPFTPDRARGSDPARVPRLLAVGRLVEKKGFSLLIEAVDVLRSRGVDVAADIAGDGPLAADLTAQIDRLGLDDRVRLLGPLTQAEVSARLGTDDVFVAPFVVGSDGNADGLPTVLLEAMARGIRCVAADVTAVGEVVVPGETGWLVPSGDVGALADALADAVQEAVAESSVHDRMVHRARALVEEHFDSRRQAAALRALVPVERTAAPVGGAR
ncbi:glycosyltransferase family 4 protein [Nesterenkonia sp. K-15-9-6]|uniref:glycosyltransferase family 4 protein n=1 Tax=Nesterenkonia sp. K-15-9-6 TaxID=3093918 RepID=UPI004043E752